VSPFWARRGSAPARKPENIDNTIGVTRRNDADSLGDPVDGDRSTASN